ncbi:MAG: hypothetical protein A3A24_03825 [Candidatus Buchananbacteria bacterium RIFCSPLOWO2_01_FULL_46_12]|uniref:Uncharacterized protein n=2 Tax=Candidatus Buchananiibacteriota TaxID=1817903 RepID=A0A1G1YR15_9BACT|nr:MAG: hypothetical protein A2744_03725 [Candidatus Buchananbacteria bacterium RIFCSPHIGHO2_01_FULL_44_11]OGY53877.1 MAG: hypothetical protein A3A24_03825 [Candidatus Buchananbacteria bacterium RIFCSPLOWO2_01_FULL_46_12]
MTTSAKALIDALVEIQTISLDVSDLTMFAQGIHRLAMEKNLDVRIVVGCHAVINRMPTQTYSRGAPMFTITIIGPRDHVDELKRDIAELLGSG